jgi:RHS repeat-associated protein
MRVLTATGDALYYLHSDHLGSTSLTTDSGGNVTARQNYYPFGQIRPGGSGTMPTDIGFTGQRAEVSLGSLYDYGARMYSPAVGRLLSADTIVPGAGNPQAFNRYAYVLNNPVKYTDPTGHDRDCGLMDRSCDDLRDEYRNSDWQKHLGFKQFIAAKDAYAHYMSNPEAAFQEGWIEDADSYMWARIYSEDVRHEWFNPLSDNFLAGKMQEARERGDVDQWYMIAIAFGISEWMSDRFGGGNPGKIYVIGKRSDTLVAKSWSGHEILDIPDWTLEKNDEWIQGIINRRATVYLASPQNENTLWDAANNRPTVYARELEQLRVAGYTQVGDYMMPPSP